MFESSIQTYLRSHSYQRIDLHAALFDMDGVLFDSMKNHAKVWQIALQHYGLHITPEEVYLNEGRTGKSTINTVSKRERGYEVSDETADEMYAYKSQLFNQCPEPQPMEGAYTLLKKVAASDVTPVIVTGSGQASLLGRLDEAFPGIFNPDRMVTARDVRYGKPNPEPYLMGLEKGNVRADQAIVVENAPLGIQAGVAAGIFTIAVNTGPLPDSALLDAGANLLFPSMQALADAWEELFEELSNCKFINCNSTLAS